jgi:hypothetical protein
MPAYTFTIYIFFKTFMQQPKQPNPAPAAPKTNNRRQMQLHQMQDKSKQPPNVLVVAV